MKFLKNFFGSKKEKVEEERKGGRKNKSSLIHASV